MSLKELKKIIATSKVPLLGLQYLIHINKEEPSPFYCILCKDALILERFNSLTLHLHLKSHKHCLNFFKLSYEKVASKLQAIKDTTERYEEDELNKLFEELIALFPIQNELPISAATIEESKIDQRYIEHNIGVEQNFQKSKNLKLEIGLLAAIKKFEDNQRRTPSSQQESSQSHVEIKKYSRNFEIGTANINKKYIEYQKNPSSHPLYNHEWESYYLKNPDAEYKSKTIWQKHFLNRLKELEKYEILEETISIRIQQGLPCDPEHESYLENFKVQQAENCSFLEKQRKKHSSNDSSHFTFSWDDDLPPIKESLIEPSSSTSNERAPLFTPQLKYPSLKRKSEGGEDDFINQNVPKKVPELVNIVKQIEARMFGSNSNVKKEQKTETKVSESTTNAFDIIDLTEDD